MKLRIFPLLALVLIISMSLSFAGCNDKGTSPEPMISNLTVSHEPVNVGSATNISVVVTNPDSKSRTYNATCYVDGLIIGSKTVDLAAKSDQTVTFSYTPTKPGTLNVTIDNLSASLQAAYLETGYGNWDIQYAVVNGSKITLNYSLGNSKGIRKDSSLTRDAGTVTLRVNKTVVNGTREVIMPSSGWRLAPITINDISPGISINLTLALSQDAKGTLYVQDGASDVDVSSVSASGGKQIQVNTYGDGKKDAAGSLLINTTLDGRAYIIQTGKTLDWPLGLTFTTGHITNIVSMPSKKFDGATLSSNGTPFAKDGGVAPYVGTAGTITTTGTGDCLGLTFESYIINVQVEIKLVLEPVTTH